jgi:hypothetical protein
VAVELVDNDRIAAQYYSSLPICRPILHLLLCAVFAVSDIVEIIPQLSRPTEATVGVLYKLALPPMLPLVRDVGS